MLAAEGVRGGTPAFAMDKPAIGGAGLEMAGGRTEGARERMLAAEGVRRGGACMCGGAVVGPEDMYRAGSEEVRIGAETGGEAGVGSEGWCRGERGEGDRGAYVEGPARDADSRESGREGKATLDVSGEDPRANGLGTRSGRPCAFGMFKDATDSWREECDEACDDLLEGGAGLRPRCTLSGVP